MSVEHVTYRVQAIGSKDAQEQARDVAHAEGRKVRTLVRIDQVDRHQRDNRRESLRWDVTLAVVVP